MVSLINFLRKNMYAILKFSELIFSFKKRTVKKHDDATHREGLLINGN